ncbi:MAG: PRC-barrel domain-containing protein [Acidimicrobiales bacterium]
MIRLRDAVGRSVVARDTAETLGSLHGAVVDAPSRRVLALQVGKGHKARLADWAAVTGLGPDAVVVESEGRLREAATEREQRVLKGDVALLGGRVLTDRGDVLGTLDDVEVDEATGDVLALVAGGTTVAADGLRSIGGYAVVVAAPPG